MSEVHATRCDGDAARAGRASVYSLFREQARRRAAAAAIDWRRVRSAAAKHRVDEVTAGLCDPHCASPRATLF